MWRSISQSFPNCCKLKNHHHLFSSLLIHGSGTRSLSSTPPTSPIMVDYFVNKLGFSRDDAVSASSKLTHLKSTKNCDLVIDIFKRYGFDDAHITNLIAVAPHLLLHKAHKTLEPKIKCFRDAGVSASALVKLITKQPRVLEGGLDSKIASRIGFLRSVLGSDDKVAKAIAKSDWIFSSYGSLERMQENVAILRDCGLAKRIENVIMDNTRFLTQKPETVRAKVARVEPELGIPRDSNMFYHGFRTLCKISKSNLEVKVGIFKSFGWCDSDICTMARTHPLCLTMSDSKIHAVLQFYMKEVGYTPTYLASRAILLTFSLEKRVKPRHHVLEILRKNKLIDARENFCSIVYLSELKFAEKYVLPFKNEVPELCENYSNRLQ